MPRYAIMVEDDQQQSYFNLEILNERGFEVAVFENYEDAVRGTDSVKRPVDIVVLDRRLPRTSTDEPADETGDELLDLLLNKFPDSPFVIFTGHTDVPHQQFTKGRGVVELGGYGDNVDRVFPFEKAQALEFAGYIDSLLVHLNRISDIDVTGASGSDESSRLNRRILKRVARHYGGSSIDVAPLFGGLTDTPVWWCKIRDDEGRIICSLVVKASLKLASGAVAGGLHTVLPAPFVAASVAVVGGVCGGRTAQIMQLAGECPSSLLELIPTDDAKASTALRTIGEVMDASLQGAQVVRTIKELVEPLVDWSLACQLLEVEGIRCPRPSVRASATIVPQHGDLHPGNILLVNDNPIVIDFDSETIASRVLDPVTALLSPLFHRASPLREESWPSIEQCGQLWSDEFLDGCPIPYWVQVCRQWIDGVSSGERENWAVVLGFAARQLKYDDVISSATAKGRAIALGRAAAEALKQD
ncbi:response regulator [Mycobacteroides chelonae]|uniref:response regulator n=1 Tax=Mycobacteroides chelonae TaxID=1774 RepID=UPI0004AB194D|nr:response regulator [Mycobacteroides chelonae]MBF9316379.1 response regulator [Mycobacteroides chelonae]OHT67744.1 hypothetical protein BKG66_24225 [Mycobacteroides chelonae]OHT69386.1 hypothetical protein BKG67_22760 [Mycobacteroides chelonae]OHT84304.1 hypothetical protein BKG70_22915 [Mycobacteroides chelonae]